MITEAFVSVEVAKLLKEKGFNIPVNYEYHYIIDIAQFHKKKHDFNGIEYSNCSKEWYSAPTHQMAMKWLREEKKIYIRIIEDAFGENYHFEIYSKNSNIKTGYYIPNYYNDTYEDAVEAALKYSLENLI